MKNMVILIGILFTIISYSLYSAEKIEIPTGKSIFVDGGFSENEWDDAGSIKISMQAGTKITVYYKHDNANFYLAYCSNLMSANNIRYPEILFDINNDKSSIWQNDDWWFHVSATDCYSKGKYGDYTTCKAVQPDWQANNMTDIDFRDTIEIIIPLTTIGIEPNGTKDFGLCFIGTDTHFDWDYWPAGADRTNPSSWAEASIDFENTGIENMEIIDVNYFFINKDNESVQFINEKENTKIAIYNSSGNMIYFSNYTEKIDLSAYPSGIYFIRTENNMKCMIKKFVVIR